MLVRKILSKYNIQLPLTENLFKLDFEGTFDKYEITETDFGTTYRCFDDHYAIQINPSSSETCLGYMYHPDKKKNGSVTIYDSNGEFVADTMCLPREF